MNRNSKNQIDVLVEVALGSHIGQLRAIPVTLGKDAPKAFAAIYCADFDVDPWVEMFFFPKDTSKIVVFDEFGQILWKRDLGPGVVPGMWFCPMLAFDLDGDGIDELWFVNNIDPQHPLGVRNYRLERVDPLSGKTTGQWQWPNNGGAQSLSSMFRNFILCGYVHGQPVLITAQGTYGPMFLQAWNPNMEMRWETTIPFEIPGARGSHMSPVVDLNGDGVDELMWGERCIELDCGRELFCADRDSYDGHSDIIQPVMDYKTGKWYLYTCREHYSDISPRVVLYDSSGQKVWGDVEFGHMDMGWVARLGENMEPVAMAIRIDNKTCGPDGRFHNNCKEFTYDALTGHKISLPFSVYRTIPVDIDGDGYHELIQGEDGGNGLIINRTGEVLAKVGGYVALAAKLLNRPGEQVLVYYPDGKVRIWGDRNAEDCESALKRYEHSFYKTSMKLTASGYNLVLLGGI